MKAFSDIEQSKKLAEILPIESADMCFANDGTAIKIDANPYNVRKLMWKDYVVEVIPCWSLAALLETLPYRLNDGSDFTIEKWKDGYLTTYGASCHKYGNELVDACYEMVLKLNELKLL